MPGPATTPENGASVAVTTQAAVAEEQVYVDKVYDRLDTLRAAYGARLAGVRREGPSGSPQNRSERDAFAAHYADTVARLDQVENRLVFGRLDLPRRRAALRRPHRPVRRRAQPAPRGLARAQRPAVLPGHRGAPGRRRAPSPPHDPGPHRRRRRGRAARQRPPRRGRGQRPDRRGGALRGDVRGPRGPHARHRRHHPGRAGRGHPLPARRRPRRPGRARHRQDRRGAAPGRLPALRPPRAPRALRRAAGGPLPGLPALHRAGAALPRRDRRRRRPPWPTCCPGRPPRRRTAEDVAAVKGRAAMAQVLARAVRGLQRVPDGVQELDVEGTTLHLQPEQVRAAMARARRSGQPHNQARDTFVLAMLDHLVREYAGTKGVDDAAERAYLTRGRAQRPGRAGGAEPVLDADDAARPARAALRPAGPARAVRAGDVGDGPGPAAPREGLAVDGGRRPAARRAGRAARPARAGRGPPRRRPRRRSRRPRSCGSPRRRSPPRASAWGWSPPRCSRSGSPPPGPGSPPPSAPRPTGRGPTATSSSTRPRSSPPWRGGRCCAAAPRGR